MLSGSEVALLVTGYTLGVVTAALIVVSSDVRADKRRRRERDAERVLDAIGSKPPRRVIHHEHSNIKLTVEGLETLRQAIGGIDSLGDMRRRFTPEALEEVRKLMPHAPPFDNAGKDR